MSPKARARAVRKPRGVGKSGSGRASREPGGPRGAGRGAVTALSHVAIATPDADALAGTLAAALGAERGDEEMLDRGALRVLFVHLGPLTLELLEPRSAGHTVARFLEKRGPGLHHLSFEVADLERTLARCRRTGAQLIDESPRPGAARARVAFLHPRSLGGVLVELVERPRAAGRRRR